MNKAEVLDDNTKPFGLVNQISHLTSESGIFVSIFHFLNEEFSHNDDHNGTVIKKRINSYRFNRFVVLFMTMNVNEFKVSSLSNLDSFIHEFEAKKNDIGYNMMWYLLERIHNSYAIEKDGETNITPWQIKSYIKTYL